MSLRP